MREIKFRAWDDVKRQMYFVGEEDDVVFSIESFGTITATDLTEHDWGYEKLEHLKYMQYTGLKDKNGKEIYEGDVVKIVSNGFVGEVVFGDGVFGIENAEELWLHKHGNLEIIGNIYENPELIN